MGGTGIPLWSNAKRTFWNGVTRMYNRHNGITPPSADEIARRARAHYLIGEAGFPNYGDEIIAREWVKYLAQVDPEVPVIFDCLCAGPAAAILHGLHPKLTVVDTVAQLCMTDRGRLWHALPEAGRASTAIEDIPAETIGAELCKALDDEGYGARYAAGIRLLTKKTQDLHIIGGGYMRSVWNANLARLSAALWAQLHHMPAVVSGVGLEPLNAADRVYAADIAKQITAFSCRDIPSRDAIDPGHTSATLAPDDCFVNALDGVYLPDDVPLPRTMVCMQTDLVDDPDALLRHMVNVLEAWHVPQGERIGVVECIPYDSQNAMQALGEHGWEPWLYPMQDLLERGFPAQAGQRWLSTRYHPHLLAAAKGCSGTFIAVQPGYYDVKHNAVLRMGSRWTQTCIGQPDIPQPGPGFADPSVRFMYRDQIRKQVAPLYGMPGGR